MFMRQIRKITLLVLIQFLLICCTEMEKLATPEIVLLPTSTPKVVSTLATVSPDFFQNADENIVFTVTVPPQNRNFLPPPPPKYWREWNIVPDLSPFALATLREGVVAGNNPNVFIRIGDCQSEPAVYLGIYDSEHWILPTDKVYLENAIEYYHGSFSRVNVTAHKGFGVSSVLSVSFADKDLCNPTETPLDCELRLTRPLVALIAMGTNWQPNSSESFERYLRQIVDSLLENGTLPVLVNKPDNIEGDFLLNQAIAEVAYDYDLPMLNIWRALDFMPGHGLKGDAMYMTPEAWDIRNLQTLILLEQIHVATLR